MITLVYASAATSAAPRLDDILSASRRNNAQNCVTGLLLFADGAFIQALEGPEKAVEETFARIQNDRRHKHIMELYCAPLDRRNFPNWSMGAWTIEHAEVPAGAFDLTLSSLDELRRHSRGEDVFSLLKSFCRACCPDDVAS